VISVFSNILVLSSTLTFSDADVSATADSTEQFPNRRIEQVAFGVGEKLVYDVGYSFITAGEAVFSVPSMDTVLGRTCYRIHFIVNSTPSFSWIYKVEDRYETIVDSAGLFPWRFSQTIREGGYHRDVSAEFDQVNHIARTESGVYPIPPYVHDAVSALYYARTFDFAAMKPGQRVELKNFSKDSTYTLAIRFLGFQKVSVDAGTFNCFLIEPLMKEGGLFKSEGRILIWLTNDDRRIPVKVSTKIVVGSIDAELRSYSGLRGPVTSRIN